MFKRIITDKCIYIKTTFEAMHRWKDAPDDVSFLRNYHRHVFHVEVSIEVTCTDREVEFFQLKRVVDRFVQIQFGDQQFEWSCEDIARQIGSYLLDKQYNVACVQVSEDDENGAYIFFNEVEERGH